MISFIVSAYNRPAALRLCLASLAVQKEEHETIVCCNATSEQMFTLHQKICDEFGVKMEATGLAGATCCYDSAEMVIKNGVPKGEWLCFPSDDSIYFARFSDQLMISALQNNWDLVYCDCVYDRGGHYMLLDVQAKLNLIDKTGFLMRASWFTHFPEINPAGCASDGLLIEDLVRRGIRHGKAPGILLVHQ